MIDTIWTVMVVIAITVMFAFVLLLFLGGTLDETETWHAIDHAIAERIKGKRREEVERDD